MRKDCINYNPNNPNLKNHCTALRNQFSCVMDCPFYEKGSKEKLEEREAEIEAYAVLHSGKKDET